MGNDNQPQTIEEQVLGKLIELVTRVAKVQKLSLPKSLATSIAKSQISSFVGNIENLNALVDKSLTIPNDAILSVLEKNNLLTN